MCLAAWSKLNLVWNSDIKVATTLPDIVGEEAELEFRAHLGLHVR
jgi:hypothetical protein